MKRDWFGLGTVRKKIIWLSKVAGVFLILSYVCFAALPFSRDVSLLLWAGLMIALILTLDVLLGQFITKPVDKLNEAAGRMANLDFSVPCDIRTKDEFGELSQSLHAMADNLQEALAKLEQEVEKERRLLQERKELVDGLSHEMKTPLGVIRAYAEGLQDTGDRDKQQKYTEVIIAETERLSGLIHTLLDLSALESGAVALTPKRFEFVEFVETAAGRLLADSPERDFELRYELPTERVFVCADKMRMEQVLDNLIVNAKKNVRSQGVIALTLSEGNGFLHFSVFNQGEPIPPQNMDKIWTKFYRGSRMTYSGSGLGLAIVAQILSMQGLAYGVRNREDGVEFFFSIPTVP